MHSVNLKVEKVAAALKFNQHYRERVRLVDGVSVKLRLVRPSDKAHLANGFSNLSGLSRHKRFFAGKQHLSEGELRYFTELDQIDHFALGVIELNKIGEEGEGVGIARFIRLDKGSETAEVALTVIDRMQGKRIGRLLLEKLIAAAAERGVKKFRFECLPENREMQNLVRSTFLAVSFKNEDGVMVAEVDVGALQAVPDAVVPIGIFSFGRSWGEFAAELLAMQIRLGSEIANHAWDSANDVRQAMDRAHEGGLAAVSWRSAERAVSS